MLHFSIPHYTHTQVRRRGEEKGKGEMGTSHPLAPTRTQSHSDPRMWWETLPGLLIVTGAVSLMGSLMSGVHSLAHDGKV